MALALLLAGSPQGNSLIQGDIPAQLRRLTDDDAGTVVNKQPLPDGGTGMDLNAGQEPAQVGNHAGNQHPALEIKLVGNTVQPDGVQP